MGVGGFAFSGEANFKLVGARHVSRACAISIEHNGHVGALGAKAGHEAFVHAVP